MAEAVQNQVLEAVVALAQATGPYASIEIGALPPDGGICMGVSGGGAVNEFMARNAVIELDVLLNGKHGEALAVSDALCLIHEALTHREEYPSGDMWQMLNISTISAPSQIEREESGQLLWGSSLRVRYFQR